MGTQNDAVKKGWAYVVFGSALLSGQTSLGAAVGGGGAVEFQIDRGFESFHTLRVSSAGDLNADGHADILLGVEGGGTAYHGQAYVIYGRADLPSSMNIPVDLPGRGAVLLGEYPYDQTAAVASLGDFDGDGTDDVGLGAPGIHDVVPSQQTAGKAFVVFGGKGFPAQLSLGRLGGRGLKIPGIIRGGGAGYRVLGAGDFNGDGLSDFLIGERGTLEFPGNAYLILSPFAEKAFIRGDVTLDGVVDISDAIYALNYLFLDGPTPRCLDAADCDDNGTLEITDSIYLLAFLFIGGPQPPLPFPIKEGDDSPDGLSCLGY